MGIPNSVRYFQKLNEMVKELASEMKGEKMKLVKLDDVLELIDGSMADLESNYENSKLQEEIKRLPTVDAEPKWIPITSRPMDEEERSEWSEKEGFILEDDEAFVYTSPLPDDGQEVLVCGRYGAVWIDKFMNDPDYGCYFEENGEMDGIVAWMPLPKPYGKEGEEDE